MSRGGRVGLHGTCLAAPARPRIRHMSMTRGAMCSAYYVIRPHLRLAAQTCRIPHSHHRFVHFILIFFIFFLLSRSCLTTGPGGRASALSRCPSRPPCTWPPCTGTGTEPRSGPTAATPRVGAGWVGRGWGGKGAGGCERGVRVKREIAPREGGAEGSNANVGPAVSSPNALPHAPPACPPRRGSLLPGSAHLCPIHVRMSLI